MVCTRVLLVSGTDGSKEPYFTCQTSKVLLSCRLVTYYTSVPLFTVVSRGVEGFGRWNRVERGIVLSDDTNTSIQPLILVK